MTNIIAPRQRGHIRYSVHPDPQQAVDREQAGATRALAEEQAADDGGRGSLVPTPLGCAVGGQPLRRSNARVHAFRRYCGVESENSGLSEHLEFLVATGEFSSREASVRSSDRTDRSAPNSSNRKARSIRICRTMRQPWLGVSTCRCAGDSAQHAGENHLVQGKDPVPIRDSR